MDKQVKMLNIQYLIILIVLLVTTVPRRVTGNTPFEDHLQNFQRTTAGRMNGINHLIALQYYAELPDDFKGKCESKYRVGLSDAGLNENSSSEKLEKVAYKALDAQIRESLSHFQRLLAPLPELSQQLRRIYDSGYYLRFAHNLFARFALRPTGVDETNYQKTTLVEFLTPYLYN